MALTEKLTNIANAIREKGGTTDALTLEGMVDAIAAIETGGGSTEGLYYIPDEVFNLTGDVSYIFSSARTNQWLADYHLDKLSTTDLTNTNGMFEQYRANPEITEIPFDFNFKEGAEHEAYNMFYRCDYIEKIGRFVNFTPIYTGQMFHGCNRLRELPDFINLDLSKLHSSTKSASSMFQYCYSLRSIPEAILKEMYNNDVNYSSSLLNAFMSCYALDEIRGVYIPDKATSNTNLMRNMFSGASRAKELIFATNDDGTPFVRGLKSQTIDLNQYVGYIGNYNNIVNYSKYSGITAETRIVDDETYQLYKNHPDSWTSYEQYSRYNHDSAVNTINSLPDTSAYLAANGGTNTIKFKGTSGSATDGGAINTLTEEEIAVAAAKGWTVSFS